MIKDTFYRRIQEYGQQKTDATKEMRAISDTLVNEFENSIRRMNKNEYERWIAGTYLEEELSEEISFKEKVLKELSEKILEIKRSYQKEIEFLRGYVLFDDEWEENLEEEKIYEQLDEILGTEEKEKGHRKVIREEDYEYILSELKAEVINVPLRLEQASENLKVEASIKIKIPFSFGFQNLPPFEMVIKTNAIYMPKF